MKISVALCTYNGEKFLQQQLESIEQQVRKPDELVACDDCSGDGTLEILKAFREGASFPVHIHRNENNLGSTKNFEQVIGLCSGDIIALCDQDDIWKPIKLERLETALQANPEAGYVFSDAELVDENAQTMPNSLWASVGFRGEVRKRFEKGEQVRCFARQHIVTGATMAFRASVGRLAMPFPIDGNWIHDGWIALVASALGSYGVPLDEPLVAYRQHSNQQIGAPKPKAEEQKKQSLLEMYHELKRNHQYLFAEWEKRYQRTLRLKEILVQMKNSHSSSVLESNLAYFQEFETHFRNRRKILTSKNLGRYGLILQEAISGRYGQFSDSWRSIFRDLFL
jgi:glycosyltransferase involved in cell wall biosynthesis